MDDDNKVAIVTGSSSGIGACAVALLASNSYCVVICGRDRIKLEKVYQKCLSITTEDRILVVVGDLSVEGVCQDIVRKTIAKFGRIDVLVNNAGQLIPGSASPGLQLEDYDAMMNLNVRAAVDITIQATPHIIQTKGMHMQ